MNSLDTVLIALGLDFVPDALSQPQLVLKYAANVYTLTFFFKKTV